MPMVYHAAHLRLRTVLRGVCRESFTVVIGKALGLFFIFYFTEGQGCCKVQLASVLM